MAQLPECPPWPCVYTETATYSRKTTTDIYKTFLDLKENEPAILLINKATCLVKACFDQWHRWAVHAQTSEQLSAVRCPAIVLEHQTICPNVILSTHPFESCTVSIKLECVFKNCYVRDFFSRINTLANIIIDRNGHKFTLYGGERGEFRGSQPYECDVDVLINHIRIRVIMDHEAPILVDTLSRLVSYAVQIRTPNPQKWHEKRRCVPHIYPLGFSRLVHKDRILTPRPLDTFDASNPRQIVFPPSGPFQCVYETFSDTYPYLGFVVNTLHNSTLYPLLPCGFKQPTRLRLKANCITYTYEFSLGTTQVNVQPIGQPLLATLMLACNCTKLEWIVRAELAGYAELCTQSCYGEPIEKLREQLKTVGTHIDPSRYWRALNAYFNIELCVYDAKEHRIIRPRCPGIYIANSSKTSVRKIWLIATSPTTFDIVKSHYTDDWPIEYYVLQTDRLVKVQTETEPGGIVTSQWIDRLGRVREYTVNYTTIVRDVLCDTFHAPILGYIDLSWDHCDPEPTPPELVFNRSEDVVTRFRATRPFVDTRTQIANVRVGRSQVMAVTNTSSALFDAVKKPYIICADESIQKKNFHLTK